MSDELARHHSLESLRKEAKRWLAALRAPAPTNAEARARLERTLPHAPANPTLRDIQHALAREHGFTGWTELREAAERAASARGVAAAASIVKYESAAEALLDAYRTGTPEAMERHYRYTWHRRAWLGMRRYVQLDLGKRPRAADAPDDDVEITLDDARYLVAMEHGFRSWDALLEFARRSAGRRVAAKPVKLFDPTPPSGSARTVAVTREWDEILRLLAERPTARLDAAGQMTDALLAEVSRIDGITSLDLGGSKELTDDGLRHLAGLPRLAHLNVSGTAITDRALDVLRELPALESISLAMTRVTDEGMALLANCHGLARIDLSWTRTGDGAIRALSGKRKVRELRSGNNVTDAGLALLHELPVFESWQGGEPEMELLRNSAEPNHLRLRGSFTDRGMRELRGLDGLFGLDIDDEQLAITAAALEPLLSLPNLGWLAVDAKDDWMPYIAELPRLRFLVVQDTTAGDDGFVALGRSRSLEYLWGRHCHNLRNRGFAALGRMPALRSLAVSCLNVDDVTLAALPEFPALRELMPMDVPDAGYRHIARCEQLESLILMYCRDATDAATEHIARRRNLSYYFNSYTTITDRTPELLSTMDSLERITFDVCHGLTNAGVAHLARLPRLRELRVSGKQLSGDVAGAFPARVSVFYEPM
jgi:hypothetical protein